MPLASVTCKPGRRRSRRGAEMLEFTLVFLPLLAIFGVTMNTAWAIFAKSTIQRAVRAGVRRGVTLTAGQMTAGACVTDMVRTEVQANSLGILRSDSGRNLIKVRFFQPPLPNATTAATEVTTQTNGNQPGNIMQVSVEGYSLVPIMPRFFNWNGHADNSPLVLAVSSADRIEPSRNPPCKGTAP
jgi:Flp pilus assembly protein TadG